jgi:thimet oligopeptidase
MRCTWLPLVCGSIIAASAHADPRPLLPVFSNAEQVNALCDAGLAVARRKIDAFAAAPHNAAAAASALRRWDEIAMQVEDFGGATDIAASVATDAKVRDAADACNVRVSSLFNGLYQNTGAYERIRLVKSAAGPDAELLKVLNEGFEDAGVTLPEARRQRAREILDRLDQLAIEFQKNTREVRANIDFAPAELGGLPPAYLERHQPGADGRVTLTMDYTDYFPFMENAVSGEARQCYFVAFNNVGGERNLVIMAEADNLRKELAGLFGKPSYAEYALQRRMAGTPQAVWRFLDQVKAKVDEVERRDLDILRQAKSAMLGTPVVDTRIERWDTFFYLERVRRERYAIDQEALRRYFPSEASVAWMFDLAHRLYGVRFVAADVPVWHPDVRYYDVLDARGKRIAGAYLDLYPRPGKYNHAAVWPVRHGSTLAGRTPISVLVANLDRKGLNHRELETLLHEFGHLLHGDLSRTRYASLSGTNVRRDFVEAPSQMFEEWTRRAAPLALMRGHCQDCPIADAALLKRLNKARLFGAGIRYARQHMLATFDMELAGSNPGDPLETWKQLEEASPLGHVPGTRFPAQFGHLLGGYAAGYYGYMWSEVIALDMASQWGKNLLDAKVSRRYLDQVLSRGGETPPQKLVRDFLGREPSPEPFFAEITGKRD